MTPRRNVFLIATAALVVLAVVYGFWPQAVVVDVARIAHGRLEVFLEAEGKTRLMERYVVSAPVAGYAERSGFDIGDPVSAGDVVAMLEPLYSEVLDSRQRAEAHAKVQRAEAALRAAQNRASAAGAASDYAGLEFDRAKRLYSQRLFPKDEFDRARAEAEHAREMLRSSQAEVDVSRFELKTAETALEFSVPGRAVEPYEGVAIGAPIDGRVIEISRRSEGAVQLGTPLVVIGDPARLEVEVDLLSANAVRVKPGMRVLLERWGGDAALDAQVRLVEPVGFTKISALGVEEQRVWVIVDILSPSVMWKTLGHGYRVQARFILWESEDALIVPTTALYRSDGGVAVFVLREGRAVHQPVTIGHSNGLSAEVLSGLSNGEMVIVHPPDTIKDGRRVRMREPA